MLGRMAPAKASENPLKALIKGFVDLEDIPLELLIEIERLMRNPQEGACQLASVCFLLSALIGPYICYFIKHKRLPLLVKSDLMEYFETSDEKALRKAKTIKARDSLERLIKEVS